MEGILKILENLHPGIDFTKEEDLIRSGILTSFDIVELIAEIVTELGISVPAHEIIPENFNSVASIESLLQRLEDE